MNSVIRLLHFANYLHIVLIPALQISNAPSISRIFIEISRFWCSIMENHCQMRQILVLSMIHIRQLTLFVHDIIKWKNEIHFDMQISRIKYLLTKCLNDSTLICLSNLNLFLHYSISYCCKRLIWFYWFNWTLNNKVISIAKIFFSNRIIFNNYHN